jgi:hypothetical protein
MSSFDFCRVCGVQRYVDGWTKPEQYIANGWVREIRTREDYNGVFEKRTQWLCIGCFESLRNCRANPY